jgi:four helix bundle protein
MHGAIMAAKPGDIQDRAFVFACEVVRFCDQARGPRSVWTLTDQLLDAGTSVGANVEEARANQSTADFVAKTFIALKETREARYWLRVLYACHPQLRQSVSPLLAEAEELVAILFTMAKNARFNPPPS